MLTYTIVIVTGRVALLAALLSALLSRNLQFQLALLTLSIIYSRLLALFSLKSLLAYAPLPLFTGEASP